MFAVRFLLPLLISLLLLAIATTPLAESFVSGWFRRDVELRADLIFQSVEDVLLERFADNSNKQTLKKLFDNIARNERVVAVGLCAQDGALLSKSSLWPETVSCPFQSSDTSRTKVLELGTGAVLMSSYPLIITEATPAFFVVLNDLTFSVRRTAKVKLYLAVFLACVLCVAALVTIIMARLTLARWLDSLRSYFRDGDRPKGMSRDLVPLIREIQRQIRDLEKEYSRHGGEASAWTEKSLQNLIKEAFPSEQLIVASFREPVSHVMDNGRLTTRRNVNGLVTALEPVVLSCTGTWIAVGTGPAGDTALDTVTIEEFGKSYRLARIRLSDADYHSFYEGICSGGLYPLCCSMGYVKPAFAAQDWTTYVKVNQMYADAIIAQSRTAAPIVFIQDYQLALVPQMVKEKLPNAVVVLFWHIPWPNSEIFSIMPWAEEFLTGILASDIVGFQTPYMCNNFIEAIKTTLEARIDREHNLVVHRDHDCLVRPYPISVEWPLARLSQIEPIEVCRKQVRKHFNIPDDAKVFIGVERLDYVKGIPERLRAFRALLQQQPLAGKVSFIQIAAQSQRQAMGAYSTLDNEIRTLCEDINKEFGTPSWMPVHLLLHNHSKEDIYRYFRASDVCVVSSLHDGMNLVAKEFIAAREDEQGVLIVSRFTGTAKELPDCVTVNPHDQQSLVQAYLDAIAMTAETQRQRMRAMRDYVRQNNIYRWAWRILSDAAILNQRRQVKQLINTIDADYTDEKQVGAILRYPVRERA